MCVCVYIYIYICVSPTCCLQRTYPGVIPIMLEVVRIMLEVIPIMLVVVINIIVIIIVIEWHYLSNATCLMRPRSFCASFVVSSIIVNCGVSLHF